MLDEMDVKILKILEETGIIQRRVAILNAPRVNVGVSVFVSVKTDQHSLAWLEKFHAAVVDFPEVIEFYRMSGEVDYLLHVVVPDIASYDHFYKKLISRVEVAKVSSAFAMERIKYTTALPLNFALGTDRGTARTGQAARTEPRSQRETTR